MSNNHPGPPARTHDTAPLIPAQARALGQTFENRRLLYGRVRQPKSTDLQVALHNEHYRASNLTPRRRSVKALEELRRLPTAAFTRGRKE